jgi:hypothetical protein
VRPADERVAQNLRDQMTYAKDHGLRALVELRHAGLIAAGCVFALAGIAALLAHYAEGELWLIPVGLLPLVTVGLQRIRLFTLTLTAVGTVFLLVFDESRWLVIMVVVVAVLAAAILAVAHVTSRFAWYGIAVFLAVQLFGAALEATRIARFPQLQPVALVRKSDDIGICGVYITQTSDRIYVGHVEVSESDRDDADPGSGRIFWVSRDDVDLVSLGPLLDIQYVNTRAAAMLREVYRDRAAEVPARTQPAEKTEQTTRETKSGEQTTTKTTTKITRDKRPSPRPKGVRTPPDCNTLDAKPLS